MIKAVLRTLATGMTQYKRAIESCDSEIAMLTEKLATANRQRDEYLAALGAHERIAAGLRAMAGEEVVANGNTEAA